MNKSKKVLTLLAICASISFPVLASTEAKNVATVTEKQGGIVGKPTTQDKVLIVMGSESDRAVMSETQRWLNWFGIPNDLVITSVHRTPDLVRSVVGGADKQGYKVVVAGAGMAAHLPGMSAAYTSLPVLGVPLEGGLPGGVDALYSVVQMPSGVPVGTFAVGKAGARNAAVMAARILALRSDAVAHRLDVLKQNQYKIE
ncbi:MAG TPA: 5-(carboxyamino)imidazole ribonucleotide mutase [Gammaproteobacteria bacterium]|nr:5-(carboxyamino)imidazole ribonucleotide mutase [Gammaproteobacteria bacterium]